MVFANKYTKTLLDKFPNFERSKILKDAIAPYTDDEVVSISAVFRGLTGYVTTELMAENNHISREELEIYQFIESMLEKYSKFPDESDEFQFVTAACTCFLENLINKASANRIKYDRFIPYLGEKSREFCRAWDEFTGVKSPGLWPEK